METVLQASPSPATAEAAPYWQQYKELILDGGQHANAMRDQILQYNINIANPDYVLRYYGDYPKGYLKPKPAPTNEQYEAWRAGGSLAAKDQSGKGMSTVCSCCGTMTVFPSSTARSLRDAYGHRVEANGGIYFSFGVKGADIAKKLGKDFDTFLDFEYDAVPYSIFFNKATEADLVPYVGSDEEEDE